MRKPHFLRGNISSYTPSHYIFFDVETKSIPHREKEVEAVLWFGWACYVRRSKNGSWSKPDWFRFTSPQPFWRWVKNHSYVGTKTILFAHSLSFDFTVTKGWRELLGMGWSSKKLIIEDPPTILSFRKSRRTIECLDTLNFFRMPLASLGKSLGLAKLSFPDYEESPELWDTYCRNDVEIIRLAIQKYIEVIDRWQVGSFRATIASQSFSAFTHRFMGHDIFIDANTNALSLARDSYTGGRTEAFRIGEYHNNFTLMDINSQYPYVMRYNDFPTKLIGVYNHVSVDDLIKCCDKYCVCANVIVDIQRPFLPYRTKERLLFPIGKFNTTLALPELKLALANDSISKVNQIVVYEKAKIFSSFVDFFYNERLKFIADNNDAFSFFCKIFLNSLYGKFGQAGIIFDEIGVCDPTDVEAWDEIDLTEKTLKRYRKFGGVIQEQKRDSESRHSHPAIAAHVTSYARAYLWGLMAEAGLEHVYYVDTDSLLLDTTGYKRLAGHVHNTKLGALKAEYETNHIILYGPKDYVMGDRTRIKGIRKNAVKIAPNQYQQPTFIGFKGMVRRGDLDKMIIRDTIKTLTREYQKGMVLKGGVVAPFLLDHISE